MRTVHPPQQPPRAKAFGGRFREACDRSPLCPPKNQGRYTWIIQRFKEIRGEKVSPETCRRWHDGLAQARRDKIHTLAQILDADPIWLETGHNSAATSFVSENPKRESLNSLAIAIRPDITVMIQNLPNDLNANEAQRLANIIQAYVVG